MADTDLMTLGFGFNSSKAISGISSIETALGRLETKHTAVKKAFEEGFNFNSSSLSDFSTIINSISQNSKNLSNVASSFKNIAATLPKLSGEKLSPISDETVARMHEFSLAGTAAGNSVRQMVGREFVTQMTVARQELGKLNAALLHVAKSGRAVREALAGIPGMLNRLSGEKVKVITPEAIESMRQYGNEVRAAAAEIKSLQGFTGQIRRSAGGVSTFQAASSGATSAVRSLGGELLNIATMSSLPMFFRNAAREATMFGAELAQIESLTLNFSADKLRQGLLALPSAFGDARKNANALYYAYSSGVEGSEKELVDFTAQMAKLSQVIRANQTDTVNAVTSAFNAYNLSVKNAAEVSDIFYGIVKRGKAEGNELASSLGQVIPTAATAGVSLNELGASVTSLTKVMNTRNAITYLNNMLSKLIKPTKESRLEAKKLGIELGLDALQAKGFSGMMQELREKTLGNRESLLRIFPDLRGQRAALQLLNKGWGDFQSQLQFFNNKAGITDLAFEKLNHSIEYQLSILPQTFGKIKIAAGEVMASILTLGGALEPVLRMFNNMSPAGQKVVGALTLLGAVYGLLKAKTFLFTTVQKSEIRHQQLLAALRGKEIAQRSAVTAAVTAETAAVTAETAARSRQAKVQKLQMFLEARNERSIAAISLYQEAKASYTAAKASGTLQQQQLALQNLRIATNNMIKEENKTLLLQNRILKTNTAIKAANGEAGIAAVTAETAAKARLAKAQKLQSLLEARNKKVRLASFALDEARTTYERYKSPTVDTEVQQRALYKFRRAEAEFLRQENKALLLQNRILQLNTGLRKDNVRAGFAAGMFGKKGFGGGFSSGIKGGFDVLTSAWGAERSTAALRQIVMMRRGLAAFGKAAGFLFGLVLKIFTPLNIIIFGATAAAVGLLDVLTSEAKGLPDNAGLWETWKGKIANSRLISTIGEKIEDFFTGSLTEAKRLSDFLDNVKDAKLKVKSMDSLGSDLTAAFTIAARNSESFTTQQELLMKNYQSALEHLNSQSMSKNVAEWKKAKENLKSFGDLGSFNWNKEIEAANKKFGTKLKGGRSGIENRYKDLAFKARQSELNANEQKELDAIVSIRKKTQKFPEGYLKLKEAAEEAEGKISPALEAFRRNGESLISFFVRQRELFGSIEAAVEAQRFAMMKPEEKMKKQDEYIAEYKKTLQTAIANGNAEQALGAVKDVMSTYTKMMKVLERSAKEMKRFASTLANDSMESMLKAVEDPQKKIKILMKRSKKLMKESGFSWDLGVPKGLDNAGLERSYSNAKKSIELQIRSLQVEIDTRKKLADAEKRANENTIKLIKSMNKFKEASIGVDAFSIEAVQLRSRRYERMPEFTPVSTAGAGLQSSQEKERALYEKLSQLADVFKMTAEDRQKQSEGQRGKYEEELKSFMAEQNKNAKDLENTINTKIKEILKKGEEIQQRLGTLISHSQKTADNTGRSAAAVSQINTVTIG